MKFRVVKVMLIMKLLVFTGGTKDLWAGGGTCSIPSCRPKVSFTSTANSAVSYQDYLAALWAAHHIWF